jgi:hypothetical protein
MDNVALPATTDGRPVPTGFEQGSTDADRRLAWPFAYVEHAAGGPRLIVGAVCVRWWNDPKHAAEAHDMADQINEDLARLLGRGPG